MTLTKNSSGLLSLLFICIAAQSAWANDPSSKGGDSHATLLVGLAVMLLIAKVGAEILERLQQPAVLGELVGGIVQRDHAAVGP